MPFDALCDFIKTRMRMSHIYQPLLIKSLVECDGMATLRQLAQAAGQTVMHSHLHVIPRRSGDVARPEGGIRGAVPEKMYYHP